MLKFKIRTKKLSPRQLRDDEIKDFKNILTMKRDLLERLHFESKRIIQSNEKSLPKRRADKVNLLWH